MRFWLQVFDCELSDRELNVHPWRVLPECLQFVAPCDPLLERAKGARVRG